MKKIAKAIGIYIGMSLLLFWTVIGTGAIIHAMDLMKNKDLRILLGIFLGPWMVWTILGPFMQLLWWSFKRRKTSKEETA